MDKQDQHSSKPVGKQVEKRDDEPDAEEYSLMELLERLETLREDMEDLGITTLKQLIERIEALHRQLDTR
jgi:hypothetical protein